MRKDDRQLHRNGKCPETSLFFFFRCFLKKIRVLLQPVTSHCLNADNFKPFHLALKKSENYFPRFPRKSLLKKKKRMSQLPAKFGNVMAVNQRTRWDRWIFLKAGLGGVVCLFYWHRATFANIYYLPFKFFLLPVSAAAGSGNRKFSFPYEYPGPSLLQGGSWLRMLCAFESSMLFTFGLFGGKGTKHLQLKPSKPVKCSF